MKMILISAVVCFIFAFTMWIFKVNVLYCAISYVLSLFLSLIIIFMFDFMNKLR